MGRRRPSERGSRRVGLLLVLAILLFAGAYVVAQRADLHAPGPPLPAGVVGTFRVHYVDVGQGDGTIWELPDGSIAIYDCGPPVVEDAVDPMVRYLREVLGRPPGSRIVALVISHGHLDHVGGCEEVFASYKVERVYETWYEGGDAPESYRRFQRGAQAEGAVLHKLADISAEKRLALPAVAATVLWPTTFGSGGWDDIAEASLVVRVEHGASSFCFQGDIGLAQERQLAAQLPADACDVYLVGHHGSRHASGQEWLARMDPEIAVASYGENAYGHPHPEAMCRVQQAGASLFVTKGATGGAIIVESDAAGVRVRQGQADHTDRCRAG